MRTHSKKYVSTTFLKCISTFLGLHWGVIINLFCSSNFQTTKALVEFAGLQEMLGSLEKDIINDAQNLIIEYSKQFIGIGNAIQNQPISDNIEPLSKFEKTIASIQSNEWIWQRSTTIYCWWIGYICG